MSAVTTHERPGVYSVYTAAPAAVASYRGGTAALAAQSSQGTEGTVYTLTSQAQAAEIFGAGDAITVLAGVMLRNGARKVYAAPVRTAEDYELAFALLGEKEDVSVVVCDSTALAVQQALKTSLETCAQRRRERIAVVSGTSTDAVGQLVSRAAALNCERMVLVAPANRSADPPTGKVAAAVAGAICGETDPAVPLGGAELQGISGLAGAYGENDIDLLIRGGVTPVEMVGGKCMVIRGVTTRTTTNGAADRTWHELTSIRVVDEVIHGIRMALQERFSRAKNTRQTREAIRSLVILELEQRKAAEIIADYGEVTAEALEDNPTVCLVTISFSVTHGLNQIWLSAQITV